MSALQENLTRVKSMMEDLGYHPGECLDCRRSDLTMGEVLAGFSPKIRRATREEVQGLLALLRNLGLDPKLVESGIRESFRPPHYNRFGFNEDGMGDCMNAGHFAQIVARLLTFGPNDPAVWQIEEE